MKKSHFIWLKAKRATFIFTFFGDAILDVHCPRCFFFKHALQHFGIETNDECLGLELSYAINLE